MDLLFDVVPTVMATMRGELRRTRPEDLNVAQVRALVFITRQPGVSPSCVAEHLDLTPSSVSKLLDGLLGLGYVDRQLSQDDRRRACLFVTAEGRQVMLAVRDHVGARLAERLAQLTPRALEAADAGLQCLGEAFPPVSAAHAASVPGLTPHEGSDAADGRTDL